MLATTITGTLNHVGQQNLFIFRLKSLNYNSQYVLPRGNEWAYTKLKFLSWRWVNITVNTLFLTNYLSKLIIHICGVWWMSVDLPELNTGYNEQGHQCDCWETHLSNPWIGTCKQFSPGPSVLWIFFGGWIALPGTEQTVFLNVISLLPIS